MRSRILTCLEAANRVLLVIGAVAVVAMMLHVVANALLRSVNNAPLTGTNEYVTYWYMPLVALLGFIVAQRDGVHTEASVLFDRLPRRNRTEIRVGGLLLTGLICLGFAWFGGQEAMDSWETKLTGGVVDVVIWPVTFLVPVAYTVLSLQVLTEAVMVVLRPGRMDHGEPVSEQS